MKLILLFLMLSGASAQAAIKHPGKTTYRVEASLTIDGIKSSTSIVVAEGQKGEVKNETQTQGGNFTEVTINKAQVDGKPGVSMEFVIGTIDTLGNKVVISTPHLLADLGEKSTIIIGSTGVGKKLILSAVATRL